MPAAPAQKTPSLARFAQRRALAPLIESPTLVFYIGLAIGILAAIVALLVVAIP